MDEAAPQLRRRRSARVKARQAVIVGAVQSTEVAIRAAAGIDGWRVPLVITLPPDREKRHSDFCDLSRVAGDVGADLHCTLSVNGEDVLERIGAIAPDLIFVVGWSQICHPPFLDLLPGRVLGYHPAALPRLRGRAAIPWTILTDEAITAGTLFWIDQGTDTGAIYEQHFFHVARDETARSLYAKHMQALEGMVGTALRRLAEGDNRSLVQDDRYATYAARRTAEDGRIDWSRPTVEIDRLIRAVGSPYPGAFTMTGGERVTLREAQAVPGGERHAACPGQVVAKSASGFLVKTVDGLLSVTRWEAASDSFPKLHQVLR